MDKNEIYRITKERLDSVHIGCFEGMDNPLLLISTQYPGIWLEHVYDSVFYAMRDRSKLYLAENTVELFISNQREDGQLPCFVLDRSKMTRVYQNAIGFSQIQECVSFAKLCLLVYKMNGKREFLQRIYKSASNWVKWLEDNRMTLGTGLVEAFVGYDTGHDNSGRLNGLSCIGNYRIDGIEQNAGILPVGDDVAPLITVDMNCNFYATLTSLSEMARELGRHGEAEDWSRRAAQVKSKLFELCFNAEDRFFYDVDKNGQQRKYLSSTIFHLFMEGVLDKESDAALIKEIYDRHISNPDEFATPYPYPSMAISDPSCEGHAQRNCWGYYSQGLIALRATLWMEQYGFEREFDYLCSKWAESWTEHFDTLKMGQELDPISGVPTKSSEWYSSTMLFYLYAVERENF